MDADVQIPFAKTRSSVWEQEGRKCEEVKVGAHSGGGGRGVVR